MGATRVAVGEEAEFGLESGREVAMRGAVDATGAMQGWSPVWSLVWSAVWCPGSSTAPLETQAPPPPPPPPPPPLLLLLASGWSPGSSPALSSASASSE